jgi:hypothetical protein
MRQTARCIDPPEMKSRGECSKKKAGRSWELRCVDVSVNTVNVATIPLLRGRQEPATSVGMTVGKSEWCGTVSLGYSPAGGQRYQVWISLR